MNAEFEARGGGDPRTNLRARIFSLPTNVLMRDLDISSAEEIRSNPFFNEFLYRVECADLCIANIKPVNGIKICVAAFRDRKRANIDLPQQDFPPLLAAIHDSIRLAAAIGNAGLQIFSNAFPCLDIAAFAVDANARVVAITPRAEDLVRGGGVFRLAQSQLRAVVSQDDPQFQAAIKRVCVLQGKSTISLAACLPMRSADETVEAIEIAPLPAEAFSLRFGPVALVIVKERRSLSVMQIARERYLLTAAEARIAEMLCEGKTLGDIARERGVAGETVKTQLKAIFAKTGVTRQSELVARFYRMSRQLQ